MRDIDIAALSRSVLWAAFALAVIFGAIAQRTHFCTMGAVSDIMTDGRLVAHAHVGGRHGRGHDRLQRMVALGWVQAAKHRLRRAALAIWLSR